MFTLHKSDTGAVVPHEYYPAAEGAYEAGQLVVMSGGMLAPLSAATEEVPPYLCMADRECEDGELLPVTRVTSDVVYETSLYEDAAEAVVPGVKMQVSSGGRQVSEGVGSFELTYAEGDEKDSMVRGRFV